MQPIATDFYFREEEIGPIFIRRLLTKVDNIEYTHEGGVDKLGTIAANAIHREEYEKLKL